MPARPTDPPHLDSQLHFGRRLRHWRISAGHTQAELGRMLMYDPSYISRVESGSRWPPRAVAQRCDDLLGAGRELAELWLVADRERRHVGGADRHRRRLLDWVAAAPSPLLRRLMNRGAERTA